MIKNFIVVGSGKGGVGKSTVSLNLAITLASKKYKVGLLDADIYGPSIPRMMGISEKPSSDQNKKILPYDKFSIKSMSIGNMVPEEKAIIWRGAMASSAIRQLISDVHWGDLDYLVIDLPPGTGDIQLSLCQNIKITGALIVSTPQEISLIDVRKAIGMFQKVNVPILGIIQNMSYLEINGSKNYLFGKNGALKESEKQKFEFLGDIPINPEICDSGDIGKPITTNKDSNIFKIFSEISDRFISSLTKNKKSEVKITN